MLLNDKLSTNLTTKNKEEAWAITIYLPRPHTFLVKRENNIEIALAKRKNLFIRTPKCLVTVWKIQFNNKTVGYGRKPAKYAGRQFKVWLCGIEVIKRVF